VKVTNPKPADATPVRASVLSAFATQIIHSSINRASRLNQSCINHIDQSLLRPRAVYPHLASDPSVSPS